MEKHIVALVLVGNYQAFGAVVAGEKARVGHLIDFQELTWLVVEVTNRAPREGPPPSATNWSIHGANPPAWSNAIVIPYPSDPRHRVEAIAAFVPAVEQ